MGKKITYTAISNHNDVNYWDCGHKHRSVVAACKCLSDMGDGGCCYHAQVYGTDNSMWDRNGLRFYD